jgi:hypothetical protein
MRALLAYIARARRLNRLQRHHFPPPAPRGEPVCRRCGVLCLCELCRGQRGLQHRCNGCEASVLYR